MAFPVEFEQRIRIQKYLDADQLLDALEKPSNSTIRINRSKWDKKPIGSEQVQWCSDGYNLRKRPSYTLDPLFHAGCYYPQESSGMFLQQVFRQTMDGAGRIKVLDLCGAPGGKSTHLSALIGDNGIVIANEVMRSRAVILAENLTKWGSSNCIVTQNDPSDFGNMPGFFDMILVDAPCSGEGMFRDTVAIREWSEENTVLCSERQKRILRDVWPSLRKNGILVYSTCTFNPAENEENISWLTIEKNAEPVKLDVSEFKDIVEYSYKKIYGYGFYPGKVQGEGLFISVVRKTTENGAGLFRFKPGKLIPVGKDEMKLAKEWSLLKEDNIMKLGNYLVAVAGSIGDFQLIDKHLKVIKPGTRIAGIKSRNKLPDHELAMSLSFRKGSIPVVNFNTEQALDYLARNNFQIENAPKGWINVRHNDVSLGFLNNIGTRFNNYYPTDWRIRMNVKNRQINDQITWE